MEFTILLALALGMDAFSAGIAVGSRKLSPFVKWGVSVLTGLLHIILPLSGMLIGSHLLEAVNWIGVVLMTLIGFQMIFAGFKKRSEEVPPMSIINWVAFSFAVSLDSLSVGITLGLTNIQDWTAVLPFGIAAFLLTRIGLALGQVVTLTAGRFSEVIGGSILIGLAMRMVQG
ncbi:manganese efflux pump MntP [Jeotgalibacillus aurantiacus]|uniref:manganese efflux pump MntP n=1 Tax=Jeotgalibacillus aurantiacus TaxID=2763266 RepID=UPI001D0A2881|nr:manganese efflux pump [Jeotgalibacillus aurantiacus]